LEKDLNCEVKVKEFETARTGSNDSLDATMQAEGLLPPTMDKIIRYHDSHYFLVPYGWKNNILLYYKSKCQQNQIEVQL
jgi:hypothetical protein